LFCKRSSKCRIPRL